LTGPVEDAPFNESILASCCKDEEVLREDELK